MLLDGEALSLFEVMSGVTVRPVRPDEVGRWKALMRKHHYLGLRHLVGETIYHVAEVEGHWVALLGWCSAALKVGARDRWIGWTPQQKQRRLQYVAQNGRFLLLTGAREVPNLASRVLALSVRRLAADWQAVHGHPVVLAETFVDGARFPGTCYRAAGWVEVGQTEGYGKNNMEYTEHGQPKRVLLRALFRGGEAWLREPFDVPALMDRGSGVDLNRLPIEGGGGLLAALARVPDHRDAHGKRHSLVFILAVTACAVLAGMRGFHQVAEFAQALPPDILRRLGCRPQESTGRIRPPSEPTIRRTMNRIDIQAFERELGEFQRRIRLSAAVALDGKTLRGSGQDAHKPQHLLAAVTHGTPTTLAQIAVGEKTNEIPEALRLLEPLDLRARVVTADAMHTQAETARQIVEVKGADYVLTVKDNQKTMRRLLAARDWALSPPRYTAHDKGHGRNETRTIQVTQSVAGLRFPHAAQGFRVERTAVLCNGKTRHEVVFGVTSLAPDRAGEVEILHLLRGHWGIEALHHIRDVSYDEDRSRARTGNGPQAMAALRNLAIALIKRFIPGTVPHGHRHLSFHPAQLLKLIGA